MNISNCSCGCTAKITEETECVGHGMSVIKCYVLSECGMTGKKFNTYDLSYPQAKEEAIKFWNNHQILKT